MRVPYILFIREAEVTDSSISKYKEELDSTASVDMILIENPW